VKVNRCFGGTSPSTFRVEKYAKHETNMNHAARRSLHPRNVGFHRTTWLYIPEDWTLHCHCYLLYGVESILRSRWSVNHSRNSPWFTVFNKNPPAVSFLKKEFISPHSFAIFLEDRFYYYLFVYGKTCPSGLLPSGFPVMSLYAFLGNLKYLFLCLDLVRNLHTRKRERSEYGERKKRGNARKTISMWFCGMGSQFELFYCNTQYGPDKERNCRQTHLH
jgi:hypothetical protein